ncbi:hypothetical protein [Nocardia alni]|nr:hypothetical protein [Nocardia alni]
MTTQAARQYRRDLIELRIGNRRMMELLGAAPVSPDEVDAVLEEES